MVSSVNVQPEPEVQTVIKSAKSEGSISISTEVVSTESVPVKELSLADSLPKQLDSTIYPNQTDEYTTQNFSSPVLLSNLSYYDLRFYDQLEDDPYQFVCVRMCESNPILASHQTLSGIGCQMDLIDWKEVGAVQEQGRGTVTELEVVGVVQ